MLTGCFLLLLLSHQSLSELITGINLNPSCTGSLTITHYDTKTELHKINRTILNLQITRKTKVTVKHTGNCCYHVFDKKNCRGEVTKTENNHAKPIKQTGAITVVRFDAKEFGETHCNQVSSRNSRESCKQIKVEAGKLAIEKENQTITIEKEVKEDNNYTPVDKDNVTIHIEKNETVSEDRFQGEMQNITEIHKFHDVSIQGEIHNITNEDNETVIIISDVEQRHLGSTATTFKKDTVVLVLTVFINLFHF